MSFVIKIIIFLIGVSLTAFGTAVYMTCNLGMVPYDAISFTISPKSPYKTRVILDVIVSITALIVGGPINIGTVMFAFGIGSLVGYFRKNIISKMLKVIV